MNYTADPLLKVGLRPDYSDAFDSMNSAIAGIATTSSSFWEANNGGIRYPGHIAVAQAQVDTIAPFAALTGTLSSGINNYESFTNGSLTTNALVLNAMHVDATANNGANWVSQDGLVEIKDGNDKNYTGLIAGDGGAAYHQGSGTVTEMNGVFSILQNNSDGGTITNAQGVRAVGLHNGTGTVTNDYGISSLLVQIGGSTTVTTHHGVHVSNPLLFAGSVGTSVGVYIESHVTGTAAYGLIVGDATTNAVWVNDSNNSTDEAGGIVFGSSRDTNLYRSAANTLKTDDTLSAAAYSVGATAGASGSFTTVDGKTVTVTSGIITSIV